MGWFRYRAPRVSSDRFLAGFSFAGLPSMELLNDGEVPLVHHLLVVLLGKWHLSIIEPGFVRRGDLKFTS